MYSDCKGIMLFVLYNMRVVGQQERPKNLHEEEDRCLMARFCMLDKTLLEYMVGIQPGMLLCLLTLKGFSLLRKNSVLAECLNISVHSFIYVVSNSLGLSSQWPGKYYPPGIHRTEHHPFTISMLPSDYGILLWILPIEYTGKVLYEY